MTKRTLETCRLFGDSQEPVEATALSSLSSLESTVLPGNTGPRSDFRQNAGKRGQMDRWSPGEEASEGDERGDAILTALSFSGARGRSGGARTLAGLDPQLLVETVLSSFCSGRSTCPW